MYTSKRRILAFRLRSRKRGDTLDVAYLTKNSPVLAKVNCMDKGYDSNDVHAHFRDKGVCSIIPARKNCRRGRYRKEMRDYFDYSQYWERNCSEYNNSSLKRRFGDYVRSTTFRAQHSEVCARVILHNLKAIILGLFHRSRSGSVNFTAQANINFINNPSIFLSGEKKKETTEGFFSQLTSCCEADEESHPEPEREEEISCI